tara:strand:+ start:698 stop:1555 length:858 start_codon:yes stop_codon:yes gene_type:complete
MEKQFKPFFKWSGGKSKEFGKVVKWMPDNYDTYYEPFVGGGAIWLGLNPQKAVIGDFYDEVSNFYNILKTEGQSFIDECNEISETYNSLIKDNVTVSKTKKEGKEQFKPAADIYYNWRKQHCLSGKQKAIRFFILRCLGYGGMLRFNSKGEFNVPFGYYKTLKKLHYPDGITTLLNNTTIHNQSWEKTMETASKNDFAFFDPPYTRQFSEYSSGNDFGADEHQKLADFFNSKQCKCMIIINKDDFTSKLYNGHIKEEYVFKYSTRYRDRLSDEDNTTYHILATNY